MNKKRIAIAISAIVSLLVGIMLITTGRADANVSYPGKYIAYVHQHDYITKYLPNTKLIQLGNLECKLMRRGASPQKLVHEGTQHTKPEVAKLIRVSVPAAARYLCPGAGGV